MLQEKQENGLLRIDNEFIRTHLGESKSCEVCENDLTEHNWVELGEYGFVERCSLMSNLCDHDGIECEQPCQCRCVDCKNATLDYENEIDE